MRVGIDVGCLLYRQMGVGSYASNLLRALGELGGEVDYTLLANSLRADSSLRESLDGLARSKGPGSPPAPPKTAGPPGLRFRVRNPRLPSALWEALKDRLGVPVELFCGLVDVFHSLDPVAPRTSRARCVATVHDLIDFALPDLFPGQYLSTPEYRRLYSVRQRILRAAMPRVDKLIAVSQNTGLDLQKYLGVPQEKIEIIPYGVEAEFRPMEEEPRRRVLARYGVQEEGFLLYVGRIEYRKNVRAVLEAMRLVRRASGSTRKLVVCGWRGYPPETEQGLRDIREMGLAESVQLLDYVAHRDLPAFYSAARVVVYPSLYEGFGLPPLEAMSCGTPVVASNVSSVPEVVGDAALSVAPGDYQGFAEAVRAAEADATLREELRARGLDRARQFTWRRAAEATLRVYRAVVARGESPCG